MSEDEAFDIMDWVFSVRDSKQKNGRSKPASRNRDTFGRNRNMAVRNHQTNFRWGIWSPKCVSSTISFFYGKTSMWASLWNFIQNVIIIIWFWFYVTLHCYTICGTQTCNQALHAAFAIIMTGPTKNECGSRVRHDVLPEILPITVGTENTGHAAFIRNRLNNVFG